MDDPKFGSKLDLEPMLKLQFEDLIFFSSNLSRPNFHDASFINEKSLEIVGQFYLRIPMKRLIRRKQTLLIHLLVRKIWTRSMRPNLEFSSLMRRFGRSFWPNPVDFGVIFLF